MSHDLETRNGKTSFAYSGKIGSTWHELGQDMGGLSSIPEILEACQGDYEVHKSPLMAVDPVMEDLAVDTGQFWTWREIPDPDTGGLDNKRQCLGVVGSDYRPIQNRTVLELATELASMSPGDQVVDCAGVLDEGRRFFATIPLPDLVIDPNGVNDRHGRNLVVVTGHDRTQSLRMVNTFTRAVCANTVSAALRGSSQSVAIRHTQNAEMAIADAKKRLGLLLTADEEFQLIARTLLDIGSSWDELEKVSDRLWPLKNPDNEREVQNQASRKERLFEIWASDRASGGVGENRYAVFQTLTEYQEHDQHIVGTSNRHNRAYRATFSRGFNTRVHNLAVALQLKAPLKSKLLGKPLTPTS